MVVVSKWNCLSQILKRKAPNGSVFCWPVIRSDTVALGFRVTTGTSEKANLVSCHLCGRPTQRRLSLIGMRIGTAIDLRAARARQAEMACPQKGEGYGYNLLQSPWHPVFSPILGLQITEALKSAHMIIICH